MRKTEAELLFLQEVREKKQAANGVHSKTGKRGYVGKMYFPFELASRKEKQAYKKAGKVIVSNLYEKILTREEFEELEEHEQRNRLQYWRTTFPIKQVQKEMGVASATFYGWIDKLGLPKLPRGGSRAKRTGAVQNKKEPVQTEAELIVPEAKQEPSVLILKGLNIAYNGSYPAEEIRKIFSKLDLLLDGEETNFDIELKIMQK